MRKRVNPDRPLTNSEKQKRYRQSHIMVDREYFIWLQLTVNKIQKFVNRMEAYYEISSY